MELNWERTFLACTRPWLPSPVLHKTRHGNPKAQETEAEAGGLRFKVLLNYIVRLRPICDT